MSQDCETLNQPVKEDVNTTSVQNKIALQPSVILSNLSTKSESSQDIDHESDRDGESESEGKEVKEDIEKTKQSNDGEICGKDENELDIKTEDDEQDADNEDDEEEKEIYCICRSTNIDKFMIACDKCMDWFHGECVDIQNKKAAKKIEEWYCPKCLGANDNLAIKYKTRKEKNEESSKQHKRTSRQCGECPACIKKDDCGKCDFCCDMRKFGGPGRLRQKCRTRQCHLLSRVRKRDFEFVAKEHGEKVQKTQHDLVNVIRTEHQYTKTNSMPPQESTSNFMSSQSSSLHHNVKPSISSLLDAINEEETLQEKQQDTSTHQFIPDHCYSMYTAPHQLPPDDDKDFVKKKVLKVKRATGSKNLQDHSDKNRQERKIKNMARKRKMAEKKENRSSKSRQQSIDKAKLQKPEQTSRVTRSSRKEKEKEVTHCLGPGCINAANAGSKYCSHECGIQLQIRRLQVILPTRRKQNKEVKYFANELSQQKINKLRETQKICQDKLLELDNEHKSLEEILEKSKGLSTLEEEEGEEEEKDSDLDLTTYCVSCGIPLAPRIAFKHMEKCWSKLECLMSFGALMRSAGNLFCDSFMNQQGTYCKRLKVMCPEHYKEKKIEPGEVCGCPLVDEDLKENNKFCRIARRKCTRHVAWERLRRGEIDLNRVHQWWKLEEALEQERQLRIEMSKRNNVLGVIFNDTYDHTEDNTLKKELLPIVSDISKELEAKENDDSRNIQSTELENNNSTDRISQSAELSGTDMDDTTTDIDIVTKQRLNEIETVSL